jgi:hypothetical protein
MAARGVTLEIENLHEFLRDLEVAESKAYRTVDAALRDHAKNVLDRSQILVPVDQSELRDSGFVGLVHRWARGFEIRFGYGAAHALYQHYGHYEHDDGRRLFLEQPLKYSRPQFLNRMKVMWARYLR